jgi:hypothetical protein
MAVASQKERFVRVNVEATLLVPDHTVAAFHHEDAVLTSVSLASDAAKRLRREVKFKM